MWRGIASTVHCCAAATCTVWWTRNPTAWVLRGSEAAVFAVGDALTGSHGVASANSRPRLMLEGLDPAAQYTDEDANTYSGVQLLTTGLELPGGWGQTPAKIWYLKKV